MSTARSSIKPNLVQDLPVFARAHEERNGELELLKREAELLRIRGHLEPHFVLNSLNAVSSSRAPVVILLS